MNSDQVPVIDVSNLPEDRQVLETLDEACRQWGFFQITGHGIPAATIESLARQMRAFFALPDDEKRTILRTAENAWGFYDKELTKNTQDWKQIFDVGPPEQDGPLAGSVPQWPAALPDFKPAIDDYFSECTKVAHRLVSGIGVNLGMPAEHLRESFGEDHTSFLRLNYYPVCEDPAEGDASLSPEKGHLGINHHTDAGAVTVLWQDDQPGLQVYRDGRWYTISPRRDALVINLGDIVQVWSNDRYQAPLHRVLASASKARYSAPFFFNPTYAANYAPLPSLVSDETPACYNPINWGKFRAGRAAGDYADYGEEIQISHFRI